MAINHRKSLSGPSPDQTTDCFNCTTTITCAPYDCDDYRQFYWPPEPPELPPSSTATTHLSPYLIVIVAVIGSAILFISYYLIMIRYCTRLRTPSGSARVDQESQQDFTNEDRHRREIDHPIWYIATVGLRPAVINSIAVVKFKKGDGLIDGTDCSVCLSEFEDDESLRLLPKCNHAFHIRCIDTWLRSHTNCPLCRAAIFPSNSNSNISETNDGNRDRGFGSNRVTEMETEGNDGDLGSNIRVQESGIQENGREIQDSKTENETVITLRRSFSMDSSAEIVFMESNLRDSNAELQSSNSRTTSMMMRSFSYGGR